MRIEQTGLAANRLSPLPTPAGTQPAFVADVDRETWLRVAQAVRDAGRRLVTLWGSDARTETNGGDERANDAPAAGLRVICAAYALDDGVLWLRLAVDENDAYPDLSSRFPCAARMQRAVHDLLGLNAAGASDTRPWLDHGRWRGDAPPLRRKATGTAAADTPRDGQDYPFVAVAGDGVHEIAVGPIHAGTIEPGHFRFSVVGEKVLRLEEQLGYAHRGIERLFGGMDAEAGYRLAGRIAGDSTVAFAWAYCMALEQARTIAVPPRALWLRALLLERERVANHLGDLGALGNDAGFAHGLAQFSRLKEEWVRLNADAFGHRYLMDRIVPGGVAVDLDDHKRIAAMLAQCDRIEAQVSSLQRIYEEQSGLQDRFARAGVLAAEIVEHYGIDGLIGRASGRSHDLRSNHAQAPYDALRVRVAGDTRGDVAARVAVRFAETYESLRLIRAILHGLPAGEIMAGQTAGRNDGAPEPARGIGWVEGWRGGVFVALEIETARDGAILRCHCHDPSWQGWPALEHAIIGNIVADFPLINKSFNLNYAGHDL
ncbi:Ni,Fe-hydrogenase III large subunit [Burkholderia sp. WAC0059]|uniref:hydrogenase large subunit n=1 Tax=Burkholderia sp. WAC0059 TaxID=2066022 RepID=UPI000C7EB777|nr:NADH-quinone oxidoreductase subunit C [Burkholderia sp. WAC0059]PLZ02186.1 Ni,Fe-hydrogenase III large subunit [Burkholderia sp. WAC0059]